jgi:hypothetical protein
MSSVRSALHHVNAWEETLVWITTSSQPKLIACGLQCSISRYTLNKYYVWYLCFPGTLQPLGTETLLPEEGH